MAGKYADLYAKLDALSLYETWFIPNLPEGVSDKRIITQGYNVRPNGHAHMACLSLSNGGFLFVRDE